MPKFSGEWFVAMIDDDPIIAVRDSRLGERIPSKEECEHAVKVLNEEGSTVIRLECRNAACAAFKSWIERARGDAAKNVYHCQVCGKAMER